MAVSKTFTLKEDLESIPMQECHYTDFASYLYKCKPVKQSQGQVLVSTNPSKHGGQVITPRFSNGFIGAIYRAYNEHRHLILRPDDVWLAITTAFSLFINAGDNAEIMRKHFVDFEGKIELKVSGQGSIRTANWNDLIGRMSEQIEQNTKDDARKWLEPDFTTTSPVCKTVGQVVLMGIMKNYFDYSFCLTCGLPKVTLEGSLEDWQNLKQKAAHFTSFNIDCLTHWAGLLKIVLQKMIDSYNGQVDNEFWSHIVAREGWSSGPKFIAGWANVFMPFSREGIYRLNDVKPEIFEWGIINQKEVPPSAVEVPVKIYDNGRVYDTLFYGGHLVCLYDSDNNTIRPSLDWAMVDITGSSGPAKDEGVLNVPQRVKEYKPEEFPKPVQFNYED